MSRMATFVLVHGAFVGGWCWHEVAPLLRQLGHEVWTPTLTGLGERSHLSSPAVGLETHIQDVLQVLEYEDLRDVTLVGWSYGGMVAAGVADRVAHRLRHLVYLDADVPGDGDTSVPASGHERLRELAGLHGQGWQVPAGVTRVERLLTDDLVGEGRRWVLDRLTPHPLATWLEPLRLSGHGVTVPTTYVRCTVGYDPEDEDTARQDRRIRSEPTWTYLEIPVGHAVPFTAPGLLADVLDSVTS